MNIEEIDSSVRGFYHKNPEEKYFETYHTQHLPRYIATVNRFKFHSFDNKTIADFGGGRGGLFTLMPKNNKYTIFDGANLKDEDIYVNDKSRYGYDVKYIQTDIERPITFDKIFDVSFCFETIEHVGNPFQVLNNIKNVTKTNGDIYISIPDQRMTHPVIYYDLFYPEINFEGFLEDMALPVMDKYFFDAGWPSWIYKTKNLEWKDKRMRFYKHENKFRNANLLESTNF